MADKNQYKYGLEFHKKECCYTAKVEDGFPR